MKAGHFRRTLRRAERQLPADRLGLVHIGIEATGEARVDRERLMTNLIETRIDRPENRRFRWGNVDFLRSEASLQRDVAVCRAFRRELSDQDGIRLCGSLAGRCHYALDAVPSARQDRTA